MYQIKIKYKSIKAKHLNLNVQVHKGGSVRIGLLNEESRPLPGRSVDECVPLAGDSLSMPVKWKTGRDVSAHAEKPTRLHVELTDAELFGFQFVSPNSKSQTQ